MVLDDKLGKVGSFEMINSIVVIIIIFITVSRVKWAESSI